MYAVCQARAQYHTTPTASSCRQPRPNRSPRSSARGSAIIAVMAKFPSIRYSVEQSYYEVTLLHRVPNGREFGHDSNDRATPCAAPRAPIWARLATTARRWRGVVLRPRPSNGVHRACRADRFWWQKRPRHGPLVGLLGPATSPAGGCRRTALGRLEGA